MTTERASTGFFSLPPAEPTARAAVMVTFLRLDRPPEAALRPCLPVLYPEGVTQLRVPGCTVGFYRYLYEHVGAAHLWWLRRAATDAALAALLADTRISIDVLYAGGEPAGFFELDRRAAPDVNLSYFGLLPHAMGQGLGGKLLRAAIAAALADSRRGVTVNTCNADHPHALPTYLRAGFTPVRTVREIWDIPLRLGMRIPEGLRG